MSAAAKTALRAQMRAARRALGADELARASCNACKNVITWDKFIEADTVLLYMAFGGEVDLSALLSVPGKRLCAPFTRGDGIMDARLIVPGEQMERGAFGIAQPTGQIVPPDEIQLVLAPALACDPSGMRLGFGGGYYDRFLLCCPARRAAVIHDFQLVDKLPSERFDVPVDHIITPTRIVACRRNDKENGIGT